MQNSKVTPRTFPPNSRFASRNARDSFDNATCFSLGNVFVFPKPLFPMGSRGHGLFPLAQPLFLCLLFGLFGSQLPPTNPFFGALRARQSFFAGINRSRT